MSVGGFDGEDVDPAAIAAAGELHFAVDEGEQGVVLAETDVLAGIDRGAALPDEDVAGADHLAVELLGAKMLRIAVPTVYR